ncbi:MAG TPA: DedA family protein [Phycisphaerae bacterium]|jgi:membrane protein DedA with SNARE-associated domain
MFDIIHQWARDSINTPQGLWVAAGLMALESMIAPVPSEFVMPPIGSALHHGTQYFNVYSAILATTAGSLIGSLISYYMGYFGGKPLVMKVGRFLLVNEYHLDVTTAWFKRWGSLTVFVCRFVPVVRHLISIPAGIARMNLLKFCVYTIIGATLWNTFLMWLGYKLEEHMDELLKYRTPIDVSIAGLLVLGVVAWYWLHLKKPSPTRKA